MNNESVVLIIQIVKDTGALEDRTTKLEKKNFQRVKRGSKIERGASYSDVVIRKRFQVLEN